MNIEQQKSYRREGDTCGESGTKSAFQRKYFFFDYDGTLAVPCTRIIPQSTRTTLQLLRERGHFVALATGRLQANALEFVKSVGIDNIVADGGYSVTLGGKLLWMEPLELEPAKQCLRSLEALHIPWAVTTANELVRYTSYETFDTLTGDYYVPTQYVPELTIDALSCIYKIYIPCPANKEQDLIDTGALDSVPFIRYNTDTVFVEPMDKQRGIRRLMDELHAPYRDVVVFGDDVNDVSMFTSEWTSIAMGNARDIIKQRAYYVTTNCDDDGIYNACKHFGWI